MVTIKRHINKCWGFWNSKSLIVRILFGMLVGTILGYLCPQVVGLSIFGSLFVGALKGIAPVLVFVLIMSSMAKAKLGQGNQFRILIVQYLLSTVLASMIAVIGGKAFPVKLYLSEVAAGNITLSLQELFSNIIQGIVTNPFEAIIQPNYLAILCWSLLVGFSLRKLASDTTKNVVSDFSAAIGKCVKWIIGFAPFGIMGLMFTNISQNGIETFFTYGRLIIVLVGCMLFSALVINAVIAGIVIKGNPYSLIFRCLKDSGVQAFFTRSSAANIPINMQLCEKMGVNKDFYSVAIPLGSTINMNGAAITITVMTLVTCYTMGIEVGILDGILLSLLATAGACGASGIAGGSLLLIPMACSMYGISQDIAMQVVAIGFLIGVVQDSVETALNSSSDALFAIASDRYVKRKQKFSNYE